MNQFAHLPRPKLNESPQHEFPSYAPVSHEDWLNRILRQLTVRGVTAVLFHDSPTWTLPERRISDDMFLYVTRGRMTIRVDGRLSRLAGGQAAHFRRGVLHSAAAESKAGPLHIISLHYTATVFQSLTLPEVLGFPDVFDLAGDRSLAVLFHQACREYALRPAGYERALEALCVRLLFAVVHQHGDWLHEPPAESTLADLHRLRPALEQINAQLAQPIAIPELARRCGFSESQFRRVFQRTMGVLPVQYLRQLRVRRACQLLRQTDQTVATIAAAVGYAETAFFAHTFKRLVGVSPGQYRTTQEV